ncbi:uncharacterized protein LOC112639132 [Camponotus floridanus]|uniref:uncharacterized protein LOC112639132 n=1 Tax=Camponotus floridanus TaxID=104421 RepID=UPI000DC6A69E|nr:uncharacterized protein LOC112639132 [Camponotus floridanus]
MGEALRRTTTACEEVEKTDAMGAMEPPPLAQTEAGDETIPKIDPGCVTKEAALPVDAKSVSWVNLMEEEEGESMQTQSTMEVEVEADMPLATKRKANRVIGDYSDSDEMKSPKLRARRAKIKNRLRSRKSTDGKEANRRKVGRPKRKIRAIDPIVAENDLQNKVGQAPDGMEKELLQKMTASDLGAQALDFMSDIETIRTKCGRMQGGLSGQLKNRVLCLQDLIRALQESNLKTNLSPSLKSNLDAKYGIMKNLPKNLPKSARRSHEEWPPLRSQDEGRLHWSSQERLSQARSQTVDSWPITGESCLQQPHVEPETENKKRKLDSLDGWDPSPLREPILTSMVFRLSTSIQQQSGPSPKEKLLGKTLNPKGIKLKGNIQLIPPRMETKGIIPEGEWKEVGKKGKIRKGKGEKKKDIGKEKKKLPKTAAINIIGSNNSFSYAEALKKIRKEISLQNLEIQTPRVRKGMNGATIIEISGPNNNEKADKLAAEVQKILADEALITRPNVKGEIRVYGMDESVTADEVREILALEGECKYEDIKVGRIGRTRSGSGVIWAQCPRSSAITLVEKQRITIGWSIVRIEMIKSRPLQCHKCWRVGHVREKCKSKNNFLGCCFKCGMEGHIAPKCTNKAKCRICTELGLNGDHRMGSVICTAIKVSVSQNARNVPPQTADDVPETQKSGTVEEQSLPERMDGITSERIDGTTSERKTDDDNLMDEAAQDLLAQTEIEKNICISIIAEPYTIPDGNTWLNSRDGHAAIHVTPNLPIYGVLKKRGRYSVSLQWKKLTIVSVYISPNVSIETYEEFLDELDLHVQEATEDLLIAGDFNSKAILWGCNYNCPRGDRLSYWITSRDLILVNQGSKPTCVRHQDSSIVDITWCNITLRPHIENWEKKRYIRWSYTKFDEDKFREAIEWSYIEAPQNINIPTTEDTIECPAQWVQETNACDYAMPRAKQITKDKVYWWSSKINDLRKTCMTSRKKWQRANRRRNKDINLIIFLEDRYREDKKNLRNEIKKAKKKAWDELIQNLDTDPWGLPYRIALKRLKKSSPSLTEVLDIQVLNRTINKLFPEDPMWNAYEEKDEQDTWREEDNVLINEISNILKKGSRPTKAPGLDGIKMTFIKKIPDTLLNRMTAMYNIYLKMGIFPKIWKKAALVLIPKGDLDLMDPKVRPICLLNELGKIMERIIEGRIRDWMDTHPPARLAPNQFGFKRSTSTCDALLVVKEVIEEARSSETMIRQMTAGVPQGSVLGPTLWNITYDYVLRTPLEKGCMIIGYADDTFVVSTATTTEEAIVKSNLQLSRILRRIKHLDLQITENKTGVIILDDNNKLKSKYQSANNNNNTGVRQSPNILQL